MALEFNGSNQYAKVEDVVHDSRPATMASWFWVNALTDGENLLSLADGSDDEHYWSLRVGHLVDNRAEVCIREGGTELKISPTNTYIPNRWNLLIARLDTSGSTIWLNGDLENSAYDANTDTPTITRAGIGVLIRSSLADYFKGRIGESAVWSYAITSREVRSLWENHKPFKSLRPRLLKGYWTLAGGNLMDQSGNGHHMTAYNSPYSAPGPRFRRGRSRAARLVVTAAAPTPPGTTDIELSWTDNAEHEDGFMVERRTDGGAWEEIATGLAADTTSYTDSGVDEGHTYEYRVKATSSTLGDSEWSNIAEETV